jgi:hypothetical protein
MREFPGTHNRRKKRSRRRKKENEEPLPNEYSLCPDISVVLALVQVQQ